MRIIPYILSAAALMAVTFSCSMKDEDAVSDGPSRVLISGHVFNSSDNLPVSGEEVWMQRSFTSSTDGNKVMRPPQTAWTSTEGFYSFESVLENDTEEYFINCGTSTRNITISRDDQSYDSARDCYIIEMVDFYL